MLTTSIQRFLFVSSVFRRGHFPLLSAAAVLVLLSFGKIIVLLIIIVESRPLLIPTKRILEGIGVFKCFSEAIHGGITKEIYRKSIVIPSHGKSIEVVSNYLGCIYFYFVTVDCPICPP
jgi:hypothetical protein